ncbi:hypothetical protein D3C72_2368900 [compost metagenome]
MITEVNGKSIASTEELTKAVQAAAVGESLKVKVSRDGQTKDITIQVGDKNTAAAYQG